MLKKHAQQSFFAPRPNGRYDAYQIAATLCLPGGVALFIWPNFTTNMLGVFVPGAQFLYIAIALAGLIALSIVCLRPISYISSRLFRFINFKYNEYTTYELTSIWPRITANIFAIVFITIIFAWLYIPVAAQIVTNMQQS